MSSEVTANGVCRGQGDEEPNADGMTLLPFSEWQFQYCEGQEELAVGAWLDNRSNTIHWRMAKVFPWRGGGDFDYLSICPWSNDGLD